MLKNLLKNLEVLLYPYLWIRAGSYNRDFDDKLSLAIDNNCLDNYNTLTCMFRVKSDQFWDDRFVVYRKNGREYDMGVVSKWSERLPKRKTQIKFLKYMKQTEKNND